MFRKILAPIDGTAPSMRALQKAIELAEAADAELVVMSVVDETHGYASVPAAGVTYVFEEQTRALDNHMSALLRHAVDLTPETVPVRHLKSYGDPAQQIIKQLGAGDYDLVVLGSRGLGTVGGTIMGSVGRRVLHGSKVPALIVREEPGDTAWREPGESAGDDDQ